MKNPLGSIVEGESLLQGRFRLTGLIGEGSYSTVYSGEDTRSGERVAVKALSSLNGGASKRDHLRLQRELKVGRSLDSPYLAGIYGWRISPDDVSYIVMEYVKGATLTETLERVGQLNPNSALEVLRQIALGLEASHEAGVVHRDLKPDNVMIVEDLSETPVPEHAVKIVDFGLAKLHARLCDTSIVEVTRKGRAVGTPRYIAPEQAKGREVGPWSDLYATGLLFYEMLTGRQAVQPDDVEGALQMHVNPDPLPLPGIDEMPRGCAQLLQRLTSKSPENRYRDAGHLVGDVEAYLEERRGRPQETATTEKPGRRVTRWSWMRPVGPAQWIETAIGSLVTLCAFTVVTAHFPNTGPAVRASIGLVPVVLAVAGALATSDHRWGRGPIRRTNLYALAVFVMSHLAIDKSWLAQMHTNADWYLQPVDGLPVFSGLSTLVRSGAQAWVGVVG